MKSETPVAGADLPLAVKISEEIKHLIYSGEIKPGERINEVTLAARMGTSRGPIREAIRLIMGFGLVTAVPNRGVYVRQLSVGQMVEISDLRALMFGYAAGLVAEQRSDRDSVELGALIDLLDQAVEAADKDRYYQLNLEFHERIIDLTKKERVKRLYDDFVKELHLFRRQNFDNLGNMRKSNAEHRLIYKAIAAGDKAAAVKHAEQHILAGCQRMLRDAV